MNLNRNLKPGVKVQLRDAVDHYGPDAVAGTITNVAEGPKGLPSGRRVVTIHWPNGSVSRESARDLVIKEDR